jgi:CRISPR-associated protein Cas2
VRSEDVRFVWLFLFFDLPVGTKPDRRWATRFRKFLKDDGFIMLQLSVYARAKNLLPKGSVRTLQVTDRQYAIRGNSRTLRRSHYHGEIGREATAVAEML